MASTMRQLWGLLRPGARLGPSRAWVGKRSWASEAKEGLSEKVEEEATSWFKEFAKSKANVIVAGGLVLLGLNFAGATAFDAYYHNQVVSTLMRGVVPPVERPAVLARSSLRQEVMSLLKPEEPTRFYHIITGSPGAGKSTLLREACAAVAGGCGYVDVSPAFEVDWGRDLGDAFNFRFEKHMTLVNVASATVLGTKVREKSEEHPLSSLRRSAEALHSAAVEYRKRTGRPFVLVVDSVDRLARGDEGARRALGALLEYAREWAQDGVITCIFVTDDDWETISQLRGVQPGSRAAPPMHVGGITPSEALQYLRSLGVEGQAAEKCVGLVGGSLLLLERCAGMVRAGVPFAEAKRSLLGMIEHGFETAGLLDATPQQEAGLAVVEALLGAKNHTLPASQWRSMVPERGMQGKLLKGGVLKFHGEELSFESRLALTYARERLYSRLSPEQQKQHKALSRARWW